MKLCVNCAHFAAVENADDALCTRQEETSFVTGKKFYRTCATLRKLESHDCGPIGIYFEPVTPETPEPHGKQDTKDSGRAGG